MAVLYSKKARVEGRENYFLDSEFFQGNYHFKKPEWFTEELSNAFRTRNKEDGIDIFTKMCEESAPIIKKGEIVRPSSPEGKDAKIK